MHGRPRLNLFGRQLLVDRIEAGGSPCTAAEAAGVSRATAYKWIRRFRVEGWIGLRDRSSRPQRSPWRLNAPAEASILELRRARKLGPHRLAVLTHRPRSTGSAVLRRPGVHRLAWLDRPTGRLIRRYEWGPPGDLGHLDVKKLGRIPPGGGHRIHGRAGHSGMKRGLGDDYIHSLGDDHSRLAYSEVLGDERGATCAGFLLRAAAFFAQFGVRLHRVMTDHAWAFRYRNDFRAALDELGAQHRRLPFHRPQVNGKVERFNRTLLEEWASVRPYTSNQERVGLLQAWLHRYNFHRAHPALGGLPPIERVNNLCGQYS